MDSASLYAITVDYVNAADTSRQSDRWILSFDRTITLVKSLLRYVTSWRAWADTVEKVTLD